MITAKLITDAWAHCRTTNNSIPDEVLDFMKDVSLAALQSQNSVKLPVSLSLPFDEVKSGILAHNAKSEYKQAAIVILRDVYSKAGGNAS